VAALLACGIALGGGGPGDALAADSPVGAHSMLQLNFPPTFMQAMFTKAAGMRASAIRLDVAPAIIFTDPSKPPDFSGLDQVIALSRQYHLPVVADLLTVPWWMANCPPGANPLQIERCGTNDLRAYRSMIVQIVAHAEPAVRHWEIWNEPDTGGFFAGSPQQYAAMLRTAHDTIKAIDPRADVLLGGLSGPTATDWLGQVFAAPGADAAHAFDIANVHQRGPLDGLAGAVSAWRRVFAVYGFTGPLWVTEHGYPADPAFQYDRAYASGAASQAAYLRASVPALLDGGAAKVFITERDNLGDQFASEGLLGGAVFDPGVAQPQVLERPAYQTMTTMAGCYVALGRDCPGPAPAVRPSMLSLPPTRLGASSVATVSLSDPGAGPLKLGQLALIAPGAGASPGPITLESDGCSGRLLEPDQPCTAAIRFTAVTGGGAAVTLQVPSDNGTAFLPVRAVAPAVSSLTSAGPDRLRFVPAAGRAGQGHAQRLVLRLTNPLSAPVAIATARLSGTNARRFAIQSNRCAAVALAPGASCSLSVRFRPTKAGTATAILTLRGDGPPASRSVR
jgi:hypothetical protein